MAEPALLRSIRRFAAEGAQGSPPHIPHHREREGLELVLELLRGRERKLHVAALRVIDRAAIVEPDSVPAGLVEEVCTLACEARSCEAASDAFKRLALRKAVTPEHHEHVLAAEERRLAMILDRLRAGRRPDPLIRAQLLGLRNPRLPPLFTPDLLALKPAATSMVLVLFKEVYTAARSRYDRELKRTVVLEGESGFDPAFVQAILPLAGHPRIPPTWMLPVVAKGHNAPWGPNEAAYPVLERLVAGDPQLAAWLHGVLEKESAYYAADGEQLAPQDDQLRAACAALLATRPRRRRRSKPRRKPS